MWVSKENENSQGQKDCKPQASPGSQKTLCLSFKFPKSARLRKRLDYQRLSRYGLRLHATAISFNYRQEGQLSARLGITVSKKYGNAVARSYFKRVVKEAFRHLLPSLPKGLDINVHPRLGAQKISKGILIEDFKSLLSLYAKS